MLILGFKVEDLSVVALEEGEVIVGLVKEVLKGDDFLFESSVFDFFLVELIHGGTVLIS